MEKQRVINMKKSLLSIVVAALMVFSASCYASDLNDNGYLASNPVFEQMVLTVDPPMVPAAMPEDCAMAGCRQSLSANYYQITTDKTTDNLVLACGTQSEWIETPTKIPIAI